MKLCVVHEQPFRERRNALQCAQLAIRDGKITEVAPSPAGEGWVLREYQVIEEA